MLYFIVLTIICCSELKVVTYEQYEAGICVLSISLPPYFFEQIDV